MKRCRFAVVLAALLIIGACDDAPVDPLDPRVDLSSLLSSDAAATDGSSKLALPALLHAAVRKVYTEQGMEAARTLVAQLRTLHDQALATASDGDGAASTDLLQRLHAEEIRIVLQVFGDPLAARVMDAVRADARLLTTAIAELEAAGGTVPDARASLARMDELVQRGAAFLQQGDAASALAAAARAAHEADTIRRGLTDVSRLPTVALLFEDAVAHLRTNDAYMAERAIEKHRALERAAQDAVEAGKRDRAYSALQAARREQIHIVLSVLGPAAAERLLAALKTAHAEAEADLTHAGASGRDVYRFDRMLEAARDLHHRASRALSSGDAATALDLGSHAADLVNTVRRALTTP